jgi:hypothetical protein
LSTDDIVVEESQEDVEAAVNEGEEEEDIGFIVLSPTLVESMLTYIDILEKLAKGEISIAEAKSFITEIKPPEIKKKKSKKTTSRKKSTRKTTGKKKASKKSSK